MIGYPAFQGKRPYEHRKSAASRLGIIRCLAFLENDACKDSFSNMAKDAEIGYNKEPWGFPEIPQAKQNRDSTTRLEIF